MRNHPYYNRKGVSTPNPELSQVPIVIHEHVPELHYTPKVVSMRDPKWLPNDHIVEMLNHAHKDDHYSVSEGYVVDKSGLIYHPMTDTDAHGGIIAAMAFARDDDDNATYAFTHIMNTENAGLRYVVCPADEANMHDLGPVENVCFIGNQDRAEGLYIPLCNTRAIADGINCLENILEDATKNDADLVPFEDDIPFTMEPPTTIEMPALPTNSTKKNHKCTCGGKYSKHKHYK